MVLDFRKAFGLAGAVSLAVIIAYYDFRNKYTFLVILNTILGIII